MTWLHIYTLINNLHNLCTYQILLNEPLFFSGWESISTFFFLPHFYFCLTDLFSQNIFKLLNIRTIKVLFSMTTSMKEFTLADTISRPKMHISTTFDLKGWEIRELKKPVFKLLLTNGVWICLAGLSNLFTVNFLNAAEQWRRRSGMGTLPL